MRIERLHIDGFGLFNDKSIEGFDKGVNVLYGLNEKGKSTLLDFFRFTLFGYPSQTIKRRPPLRGGNHGGRIDLRHSSGSKLSLYRAGDHKFEFSVDGIAADEMRYKQLIGGASKSLYDNVYAITLDELINLSSLEESGMEDRIFSLGMGINVDLGRFEKSLKEGAENLYLPRGSTQTIVNLRNKIESVQSKIKILQGNLLAFNENSAALNTARKELQIARKEKEVLEKEASRLTAYLNATDAFARYHRANSDLASFEGFKMQPNQILEVYKLHERSLTDSKELLEIKEGERLALESEKNSIVLNEKFHDKFELLEVLKSTLSLYAANIETYERDKALYLEVQQKISQALNDLGNEYSLEQLLSLKGLKSLGENAKEIESARVQLENRLKRDEDSALRLSANLKYEENQLEKKKRQIEDLSIKNEEELAAKKAKSIALKTEYESALSGDPSSESALQKAVNWIAVVALLIAAAFLWKNNNFLIAGFTVTIAIVLIVAKVLGKNRKVDKSDGRSILSMNEERAHIDNQIDTYESELKILEAEEEKFKRLNEEVRQIGVLIEKTRTEIQLLSNQWKSILEEYGLSERLLPKNVENFLNIVYNLQERQIESERFKKELEKKEEEIKSFQMKVLEVDEEHSISVESVKLLINQMSEALNNKTTKKQKQLAVEQKIAEIKGLEKRIANFEDELKKKHTQINVKDERAFHEHYERQEQFESLTNQKKDALENIQIHCGRDEQFDQSIDFLEKHSKAEIEQQLMGVNSAIVAKVELISETDKRIGKLTAEGNSLLKEKDLLELQNKREVLLVQYEDAVKKWISYRMAIEVLNESKKRYEKDKQPEVIRHTKKYFQSITNNAYRDLRISLSERRVEVIDDAGKSKTVEELSRGTREQLLLALRMGLIEEYETTVEPLPLALDDVMVNFDNPRAERLAEVLTDFAKDRQVLLFTCHQHSSDLFKEKDGRILKW